MLEKSNRYFVVWRFYNNTDESALLKLYVAYSSTKTYAVGTRKNRLNETVLFSTKHKSFKNKYSQCYAHLAYFDL